MLEDHPWFEVTAVTASDASAGKAYADAARWFQSTPMPAKVATRRVLASNLEVGSSRACCSRPSTRASLGPLEADLAATGHLVVSNTKNHRLDPDVPLLVPEVNADHLGLARYQSSFSRGGAILTNPNCSTIGLALALAPLHAEFGVEEKVHVVTLQAVSGAGMPGVRACRSSTTWCRTSVARSARRARSSAASRAPTPTRAASSTPASR